MLRKGTSVAKAPKGDHRPAWGFFWDPLIGKVRPLCGNPKPKPKGHGTRNP